MASAIFLPSAGMDGKSFLAGRGTTSTTPSWRRKLRMKNQHLIDGLSISDKVELLQHLYADIAGHGTDGDTELAHVNRFEAQVLRNIGGSGTINQVTGLRQFGKGGGGSSQQPQPTQSSSSI